MATFLILAPFAAFAGLTMIASASLSLFAAAAVAIGIVVWDAVRGQSIKMLTAGSALLFAAIGCYVTWIDGNWTKPALHLMIDLGVLAIALLSLVIRSPFTLQYARERVDAATMKLPGFLAANYVITWAWTVAFVLMLLADLLVIFVPGSPLWIGFATAFAARNAALYFTRWYPQYRRAKYAPQQTAAHKS